MLNWCCIAAVNNERVLQGNLASSPALVAEPERLIVMRDQPTAGIAYNRGLDRTRAEVCVFAHQDVYLPRGWDERLARAIERVEEVDPDWGVLGIYGVKPCGNHAGRVWDTGLEQEFHAPFETPTPVDSLDELLIILRRSSGLRFDEKMPSFHLFGTDIVQQARAEGLGAYAIEAPVVHNSILVLSLSGAFMTCYGYLARKWRDELPIKTTVTKVTRWGLKLRWRNLRKLQRPARIRRLRAESEAKARRDPAEIARMLGYE